MFRVLGLAVVCADIVFAQGSGVIFGRLASANPPRIMQLAAKFYF